MQEDDLIARHFAPLAGPGALGLRDDAAVMTPSAGHDLVVTVDAVVAGVHFFADDPAESVARKALRVNLSDLAAKGAVPRGFLLTLAAGEALSESWLTEFARGLGADSAAYAIPLLGGDTVRMPGPLLLSVTAFGEVPAGRMVPRGGATPGLVLGVTGTIGDAALGLRARLEPEAAWVRELPETARHHLLDRYLHPQPRNALADALREHAVAAMDVSDGLLGDLAKMMRAQRDPSQRATARLVVPDVPLSPAARQALAGDPALMRAIVTGGDDYEVLFAATEEGFAGLASAGREQGIAVTRIGSTQAWQGQPLQLEGAPADWLAGPLKFEHRLGA